jgi:small-conductance mechanosensitive channel
MKRLNKPSILMLFNLVVVASNAAAVAKKNLAQDPVHLARLERRRTCNALYQQIVPQICMDWRGKHGLAALYDLLSETTPTQRQFKSSFSSSYEAAYGRVPNAMPLALPRFEMMKNNFRVLQKKYAALLDAQNGQGCPSCPSVPPPPSCDEQATKLQKQQLEQTQQLNDSVAVATKTVADLHNELSKKKVVEKDLEEKITSLTQQLDSLTTALNRHQPSGAQGQDTAADLARKQQEEMMRKFEQEKAQLEKYYEDKMNSLTNDLVDTSKKLAELTHKLQDVKGGASMNEEELQRVKDQLTKTKNDLDDAQKQTLQEKQNVQLTKETFEQLKNRLDGFMSNERQLSSEYDKYGEIFISQDTYEPSSIRSIVNALQGKWNTYNDSIDSLNQTLRSIGMADLKVTPSECLALKVKGALMYYPEEEVEEKVDVTVKAQVRA